MGSIDTILFDLDGSLLPMDQDAFVRLYMEALGRAFAPEGLEPGKLTGSVWKGVEAMIRNDGSMSNRERFWHVFSGAMGEDMEGREPQFVKFYETSLGKQKRQPGFRLCLRRWCAFLRKRVIR